MQRSDDLAQKLAIWFPDAEVLLSKQAMRKSENINVTKVEFISDTNNIDFYSHFFKDRSNVLLSIAN